MGRSQYAEQQTASPRSGLLRVPGRVCTVWALLMVLFACEGVDQEAGPASTSSIREPTGDRSARITRVVNGLRHEITFTNRPDSAMSITSRMGHYRVPAVAIAVIDDYRVAWVRTFGSKRAGADQPVTEETLYHAKSVSKPVAAVSALKLVERGELSLDVPLDSLLTSWSVPDNDHTRATEPTLRHLLSHSGGFTRGGVDSYLPSEELPTLLESLRGRAPATVDPVTVDFEPGTGTRYSGGGYGVLQLLLQDRTGRSFAALADSLVFRPLGMHHSYFPRKMPAELEPFAATGHDVHGEPVPGGREILPIQAAGGLWSTARDLARFVVALEEAWAGRSDDLLGRATVREMMTPHADDWGLGLRLSRPDSVLRFQHTGSGDGFRAIIVGYPSRGDGAVVLANADGAGELRYEILRAAAAEYGWPGYRRDRRTMASVDSGSVAQLAGHYEWNSGIVTTVRYRDGRLEARFGDEGRFRPLMPIGTDEFVTWSNEVYAFRRDSAGTPAGLTWRGENGDEYSAVRLDAGP